ncbi:MAG: hypothetical protein AVDCRST_MAG87-650 [uncultured Thermomicrobiales bacterium]|uniref:Uncharacterized protein n=1 Tax=uncultured Thermomicrobiales bacterium TaxID=1645740 RepID=A0A6J4UIJ3_9BACT|nr:MAG: hypothetical protein AVDCRST_MAG87-650 [uncultured Thermomicrobiales bacterium]
MPRLPVVVASVTDVATIDARRIMNPIINVPGHARRLMFRW